MSIKLVIVDDAPFIRESIRHLLVGTDFQCVGEASNGLEAIKIITQTQPDVILMDLVLPEKNGIQVTKEVIQKWPHIKVVACSTEGQKEMTLLALQSGCCQFVVKPFTKEKLIAALNFAAVSKNPKGNAFGNKLELEE